jgi:ABC-2 type transport system ATP-binding protein
MRKVEILRGVSLEVEKNRVFGFLGPNGAGKTTLIQLLVGIRRPTSGEVLIQGHRATSNEAKKLIGFLPERPYFYDFLTGETFLKRFGKLGGLEDSVLKKRVPKILDRVGMSHAAQLTLRKYSKGMLQRIGIAQALLRDPELIVLDEPMSGLDPLGRREVRELILKLKEDGKTVFFSSHVIPDVEAVCDEVAILQKGKIVSAGSLSELLRDREAGVEVVFGNVEREKAKRFHKGVATLGESFKCVVADQNAATELAARVIEARGQILSINPVRPSLEDLVTE